MIKQWEQAASTNVGHNPSLIMNAVDISQTPLVRKHGVRGAKLFASLWFPPLYAFLVAFTAALPVVGPEIAPGGRRIVFGCIAGGLVVLATSLLTQMRLEYWEAIERLEAQDKPVNVGTSQQGRARLSIRVVAGILSALMLLMAPVLLYMAVDGVWQAWPFALSSLFAGLGFGGAAWTGQWFCFRKR